MNTPELTRVVERAEHLLWVLARQDVECLSERRGGILRRLQELEESARSLGVSDLYQEVLRGAPGTKIML
jgi:hypothetical protein